MCGLVAPSLVAAFTDAPLLVLEESPLQVLSLKLTDLAPNQLLGPGDGILGGGRDLEGACLVLVGPDAAARTSVGYDGLDVGTPLADDSPHQGGRGGLGVPVDAGTRL